MWRRWSRRRRRLSVRGPVSKICFAVSCFPTVPCVEFDGWAVFFLGHVMSAARPFYFLWAGLRAGDVGDVMAW